MASLEDFVPSRSSERKSAVCVFERGTTREEGGKGAGERMLLDTAYVRMLTFQGQQRQQDLSKILRTKNTK